MTVESIQNYLGAKLPLELGAQQHFRLLGNVFVLVFVSALVIHLLVEQETRPLHMLMHAVMIGLVYVVAVAIASGFLYTIRNSVSEVRVWQVWIVSSVSLVVGYYLLPIDYMPVRLPGAVANAHSGPLEITQLLPVWYLITYLFIQPYLNEGLKVELSRLREINALLEESQVEVVAQPGSPPVHFKAGGTSFTLNAGSIRNIAVVDHYCYVYFKHAGGYTKRDIAMPLRDVQALLPEQFILVHRSHIVNLNCIDSISREKRKLRLVLNGDFVVPVSRHRLDTVLPLIHARNGSAMH